MKAKFFLVIMTCFFARLAIYGEEKRIAESLDNKGRRGQYSCPAPAPGCYPYIVIVPESYSEKNPAGIFLYLCHADDLGTHVKYAAMKRFHKIFVEPLNLIGIIIEPKPAAEARLDPEKKAKSAEHAIAQVLADYEIVVGRGIVYSTGGGGSAHRLLFERSGGTPSYKFPFCTNVLNSCRFGQTSIKSSLMNWYLNIGEKELYLPPSRSSRGAMEDRMAQLVQNIDDECRDVYFKIIAGATHGTGISQNEPAVEAFKRADAAFAPFICQSQFDAKGISKAVDLANQHQFAKALKALGPIREEKDTDAEKKKKRRIFIVPGGGGTSSRGRGANFNRQASLIRNAIARKIKEKKEFAEKIMKQDPVVGIYYLEQFKKDCAGLKQGKFFEKMYAMAIKSKENKKLLVLFQEFCKLYPELYDGKTGRINPDKVEFMQNLKEAFGEESNLGKMVRERLEMTQSKSKKPHPKKRPKG